MPLFCFILNRYFPHNYTIPYPHAHRQPKRHNNKHAPPHCCMVKRVCFEINDYFERILYSHVNLIGFIQRAELSNICHHCPEGELRLSFLHFQDALQVPLLLRKLHRMRYQQEYLLYLRSPCRLQMPHHCRL